jgi:hypothetical protein
MSQNLQHEKDKGNIPPDPTAQQENGAFHDPEVQQNGGLPDPTAQQEKALPTTDSNRKRRIKCEALKGGKIIVGSETVNVDESGVFEVSESEAVRLLAIPGYTEA